jgi:TonB family protein
MKITKEQRFAVTSTIIFLIFFSGLLLIFGFSSPFPPPEEEGILINFGTDETGSGMVEPKPANNLVEEKTEPEPVKTEPVKSDNAKEEVVTQDFDKTAVIEEKKRKEKERLKQEKRKKEQEELERQRIEKERHRQEQQQKEINNRAKNAFGGKNPSGDNTGEGEDSGKGNQGKPDGDINSTNRIGGSTGGNGISFNLSGRSHRSLPKPQKIHKSEGYVVVEVTVDQNGNVTSARAGVKGTTISDENVWKVAKDAALKAKFNVDRNAPALQKGTIKYYFGFE